MEKDAADGPKCIARATAILLARVSREFRGGLQQQARYARLPECVDHLRIQRGKERERERKREADPQGTLSLRMGKRVVRAETYK